MKNQDTPNPGSNTPNPGSDEAIKLGCTCPILDNARGAGYLGIDNLFVYSSGCPVHKIVEKEVDK